MKWEENERAHIVILADYTNVIKSFKLTFSSIHGTENVKIKYQKYRSTKNQNTKRRKPSFTRRIGRKCRLTWTRGEQNNDHTRIMHKIQFRSSFKTMFCSGFCLTGQNCFSIFVTIHCVITIKTVLSNKNLYRSFKNVFSFSHFLRGLLFEFPVY